MGLYSPKVHDDNVTITWVFNENGVPFISSNVSTNCETSTEISSVHSSMTGTQVIKLTQRPPPCRYHVYSHRIHVANLLHSIDRPGYLVPLPLHNSVSPWKLVYLTLENTEQVCLISSFWSACWSLSYQHATTVFTQPGFTIQAFMFWLF